MSLLFESSLGCLYIIYTTSARTYPVAGVTISSIHCVARDKGAMVRFSVKPWLF